MKCKWKVVKLGEICDKIGSGATPKGGKDVYGTEGISLFRSQNVLDFTFSDGGLAFINEEQAQKLNNVEVKSGDVLLNITGDSVARACIVEDEYLPARVNQHVAIIRGNAEKVLSSYLLYFLQREKPHLLQLASAGATRNALTKGMIEQLDIALPLLDEQHRIVGVLDALQKKIHINNKINNNLEQQARSLFKAWFVDFELNCGVTPSHWHYSPLSSIAKISTEVFSPAKNPNIVVEHYSIPSYDEKHYPVFEISNSIKSNKYRLTSNSVMISKLNPDTKRIWRPYCITDRPVCSTEFIVYEPINHLYKDFVYSIIDSVSFSAFLCSHATGSTNSRQRVTPRITLSYDIVLPDDETIRSFCSIVSPIYDAIENNIKENQKLAETRNKLLPRLMSGELDVSDIDI